MDSYYFYAISAFFRFQLRKIGQVLPQVCLLWPGEFLEVIESHLSNGCILQHSLVKQSLGQPLCMTVK